MTELKYPLFDGQKVWEGAAVTVENGIITALRECPPEECGEGFLMPGLIDAHAHMGSMAHVEAMLRNGITATCDVSASSELEAASGQLEIVRSAGMAMGMVLNPKGFVERCAVNGARYIKVLLFSPFSIGKSALRGIIKAAHDRDLKVAVHATELVTVRQAVEAGADVLLHVPMKEPFPEELARQIKAKGIAVAPTLVMMETFCKNGQSGCKESDYPNAENAVRLLHRCGVPILAATDANPGGFAPAVAYGSSIHHELVLLKNAGLTPVEVLTAATSASAEVFGLNAGRIAPGQPTTMLLIHGWPDRRITDSRNIQKIWVKGEPLK